MRWGMESMRSHDVFISYSTKNKNVADAVVANFEQHGIKCWYAPRDILPGEEWVSAIREGLNIATIFVLIYTDESNQSRQVMNEVALAFNAGKTLIPFRLTESLMNNELEYYLTRVHWLDAVTETLEININKLREYVALVLGRTTGEVPVLHNTGNTSSLGASGSSHNTRTSGSIHNIGATASSHNVGASGSVHNISSAGTLPGGENNPVQADGSASKKKGSKKKIIIPAAAVALVVAIVVGIFIFGGKGKKKSGTANDFENGLVAYYSDDRNGEETEKAEELFGRAADKGKADSYYYLGRLSERAYDYKSAREYYEKGVEKGSALAKTGLAGIYLNGKGISTDIAKAEKLYNEALSGGAEEANFGLGIIAWKGMNGDDDGAEPDAAKALEYFEKAAETSDDKEAAGYAYIYMGEVYRFGTGGVASDMSKAEAYYIKAYEKYPYLEGEAKYFAGMGFDMADDTIHADRYYTEAREALEKNAAAGDLLSLNYLGNIYRFGFGVKAEGITAYSEYYKKAADAGSLDAMHRIGMMYKNGDGGLTVNYEEAFEWLSRAAALGDGASMKAIGDLYYSGKYGLMDDGERNYEKAIYYYEEATRAGNADAYIALSEMYRLGRGFNKDMAKAKDDLLAAVRLGSSDALYWLGLYYMEYADENGEAKDPDKAAELFNRAAEAGSSEALNYLGLIYYNGTDFATGMDKAEREATAEKYLLASVQAGQNKHAFENLGFLYWKKAYSAGSEEDKEKLFAKALVYYNKAVDAGSVTAYTAIGRMYYFGNIGTTADGQADHEEAVKWFQRAEAGGDGEAMYYLATEYLHGTNAVAQNTDAACEKATAALDAGYTDAEDILIEIAERYCNDDFQYSIASEYDKAIKIYDKLLDAGIENSRMYYRLGCFYYFGQSVDVDYSRAADYFEKALEIGFNGNELGWIYGTLAQLYYNGTEGVAKDMSKAAGCAEKGADLGNGSAMMMLSFLYQDGYYSSDQDSNKKKCMEYELKGAEVFGNTAGNESVYSAVLGIIEENLETGYFDSELFKTTISSLQAAGEIGDKIAADAMALLK